MSDLEIIQKIDSTLKRVLHAEKKSVVLHEPVFHGNEWNYVKDCIDTGWVSSVGKYVNQFEQMLQEFVGVANAVACVNGTSALQICLRLVGVQPHDEVLLPALTFVATANAVMHCGAIPHFVDSNENHFGICPKTLKEYLQDIVELKNNQPYNRFTGRRLAAIVPVHVFGHPIDMDEFMAVAKEFKLPVVEDAAESLGSYYQNKHTGSFGAVSAMSFNGNKIVTTGGGGAILTNDVALGKRAKHLTTTAKVQHAWEYFHDELGYNYRMPNINAALGCAQLEELPKFLVQKRTLANRYKDAFSQADGFQFVVEPSFAKSNYWLNAIVLQKPDLHLRDAILKTTNASGVMTRPCWVLMHKLPMYQSCPKMDLSVAESLEKRVINIPSGAALGAADV